MIPSLLTRLTVALLVAAPLVRGDEAMDAVKRLAGATMGAFNKADADALGALFAEDGQWRVDDREPIAGRKAIVDALKEVFAKNRGAQFSLETESARFLTPEVLLEKGVAHAGGDSSRYICTYVKKGSTWLIAELDETTLTSADPATYALDDLAWLVGSWKDNSPGIEVTATVDWTKNQHFLRRSLNVARADTEPMNATEIIGFDPTTGDIRSWVFDSEGGFGEGVWRREANKWLISSNATAPDGSRSTAQHIITIVDENKFTWESINREREGEALPNIDRVEVVRSTAK